MGQDAPQKNTAINLKAQNVKPSAGPRNPFIDIAPNKNTSSGFRRSWETLLDHRSKLD